MSPRPKSDVTKNKRFEIRLSEETEKKLNECAETLKITKTDVIHLGIDLVKSEIDKKIDISRPWKVKQLISIPDRLLYLKSILY